MAVPQPQRQDIPVAAVIPLGRSVPTVLAAGAFLKNTVCLAEGREALVSDDVGTLETAEALLRYEDTLEAVLAAAGRSPVAVAHDRHPDFPSTRHAEAIAARLGARAVPVQHHHAHIAAIMAEHGIAGPTLGLALDGFGLGEGDESWGGELLLVDGEGYRRLGHLSPLPQPGGDAAARQPWRMGAAALHVLGRTAEIGKRYAAMEGAQVIARMLERGVNAPPTSSCGRLFDAACGLLGVKSVARFEGEAPMTLEAMATEPRIEPAGWRLKDGVLDLSPLLDRLTDLDGTGGANLFHGTLAAALAEWVAWAAEETGVRRVALGGGCFLNAVMKSCLMEALGRRGIGVLSPLRLGPGDGAISLGQAWAVALKEG